MDKLLEVENLTVTFTRPGRPPLRALEDVSFELGAGEILGVVGESGSGKSTAARAVARLIEPDSGSIRLHGRDITHARGKQLRQIYGRLQMVFQNPTGSFDPRRTLGEGIGESMRNRGFSRADTDARTAQLLTQCGLPADFAGRCPHEVSGGQCQRAAIARALAIEPEILICDEATSALDVTVQKQIIELLQGLQRAHGLSYIFICHNLALVQMFCHRVLVLHEGRVVEQGTPDEVIRSPRSEYTKRLVESGL